MKFLSMENKPLYPVNPWLITEEDFCPKRNLLSETMFALANGYIGIRGGFEEGPDGLSRSIDGIYLNGFYESVPIPHAERGYGYALNTQTILNVTDSKKIKLYLEDEPFSLGSGTLLKFRRTLHMKEGYQSRELTWRSPEGREIMLTVKRLVPFRRRHLLAFMYQVVPLNFAGSITICSSLNGDVDNHTHEDEDPRFSAALGHLRLAVTGITSEGTRAVMTQETKRSQLTMACAMENHLLEGTPIKVDNEKTPKEVTTRFRVEARKNQKVTLAKYAAYYTSRDYPVEELSRLAEEEAAGARDTGFEVLLGEQKRYCERYWDTVGVSIEGDPRTEQGLRFNLFHLLQAAGSNGRTSIPAKGLTSEGYDGHYFWDTEIYMLPFFSAVKPAEARKLLEYRYSILDHARSRARELSHRKGALYLWRTIAGEEGSSYYPAGTAQYHINAAIAHAIFKYIEVTGDYSLMLDFGAEIIFETARLWEDLGTYAPRKGNRFCFNEVTGPDEYTALVNNNCYTNLMAQWHLKYAYDTSLLLKRNHPDEYRRISEKIGLRDEEPQAWLLASEYMYIPFDETMQIHPQDDGFLEKEVWDIAATPLDKYPLFLHYHPLVIYRFQVCKQPDIILAHFLLGDRFSPEQKQRDYKYYEPITTHDSSLSPSIFSIVSAEIGYRDDARRFFTVSARLDLDNITRATHYGVHMANMAGSWMCLVHGFAGMRTRAGELSFDPYLPHGMKRYRFKTGFRERRLEVAVNRKSVTYRLLEGEPLAFMHRGEPVRLTAGESINCGVTAGGQKGWDEINASRRRTRTY